MFLFLAVVCGGDPPLTVTNLCPTALTVTNKCPAPVAAAKTGYPVHQTRWTYPGEIHSHLKSGQHAGKWPAWWIDTLTRQQAESLHDADHEGRVDWSYVPSATKVSSKTPANTPIYTPKYTGYSPEYCPPGSSH